MHSEIRILLCCRALDEGLNVPETDVGIILSSTGSLRQRIQRIGRILRKHSKRTAKNVYYLHVKDSAEYDRLIPEEICGDIPIYDLHYNSETGIFTYPDYDRLTFDLMKEISCNGAAPEVLNELDRNLKRGLIRGDWQTSEEICIENIKAAENRAERNYWISLLRFKKMR